VTDPREPFETDSAVEGTDLDDARFDVRGSVDNDTDAGEPGTAESSSDTADLDTASEVADVAPEIEGGDPQSLVSDPLVEPADVAAALRALASFPGARKLVILGGRGKAEPYAPLAEAFAPGDRAYLIGEATEAIAAALDEAGVVQVGGGEAFDRALGLEGLAGVGHRYLFLVRGASVRGAGISRRRRAHPWRRAGRDRTPGRP
jgi:hypothetical protein